MFKVQTLSPIRTHFSLGSHLDLQSRSTTTGIVLAHGLNYVSIVNWRHSREESDILPLRVGIGGSLTPAQALQGIPRPLSGMKAVENRDQRRLGLVLVAVN